MGPAALSPGHRRGKGHQVRRAKHSKKAGKATGGRESFPNFVNFAAGDL